MKNKVRQIAKTLVKLFFFVLFLAVSWRAYVLTPKVFLEPIAGMEPLTLPVHLNFFPNSDTKALVCEKMGKLQWVDFERQRVTEVLDLSDVLFTGHLEAGLLSTAFDPQFLENQYIYVFYSIKTPPRARVSRFKVRLNEDKTEILSVDKSSELVIVEWEKEQLHHYGGHVLFDKDDLMFVTVGEDVFGGPNENILRGKSIRGSILRLDVRNSTQERPYSIPSDNPFVNDETIKSEIYAMGLRNPWRMHFDPSLGKYIIGDTGNHEREEHNILQKGADYGWPEFEGELCNREPCKDDGEQDPMLSLTHHMVRTAIPGFIYQGTAIPSLQGKYIFSDYVRGLFAVDIADVENPVSSLFFSAVNPIYFKLPIRFGENRGNKHGIVSIHNIKNELIVVDINSSLYRVKPAPFKEQFLGFFYQYIKF